MSVPEAWHSLGVFTDARIALGRTGNALPTNRVLDFRLAHARARDAVHSPFDPAALRSRLSGIETVVLETQAPDRQTYLARPYCGRRLSQQSHQALVRGKFDAALVIADGLSARGIFAHGPALAAAIFESLPEIRWSPTSIVSGGRVAVGDEISEGLGAEFVIVMIGERPGLSAPDSVGLYLTYRPRPGLTKDADRNCVSNVRPHGLPIVEAARRLAWLVRAARGLGLTGTALKEAAPDGTPTLSNDGAATDAKLR